MGRPTRWLAAVERGSAAELLRSSFGLDGNRTYRSNRVRHSNQLYSTTLAWRAPSWGAARFISVSRFAFEKRGDGIDQGRSGGAQFVDAIAHDLFEEFFATREKENQDAAAVVAAAGAADITVCFQAVDEFDDAVVFQRKALGERADGGFDAHGEAAEGEQNQILLRFEPCSARHGVAFAEEMANAVAQLGERAIFVGGDVRGHWISLS